MKISFTNIMSFTLSYKKDQDLYIILKYFPFKFLNAETE